VPTAHPYLSEDDSLSSASFHPDKRLPRKDGTPQTVGIYPQGQDAVPSYQQAGPVACRESLAHGLGLFHRHGADINPRS
jgi:hypothetical protein